MLYDFLERMFMFEKQDDGKGDDVQDPKEEEQNEEPPKEKEEENNEPKTFTQEELNAVAAKTKNKARLAVLKELGYDSEEAYQKAKEEKEKKKPLEEKLKTKESEASEALSRAEKAEAQLEALKMDIPSGKVERAVKLARTYEGDTMKEKLEAMLKDYPEFKTAGFQKFGNKSGGSKGKTEAQIIEEQFKSGMNGL
jgi:hypothetical protein